MGINIQARQDITYLFSSLGSSTANVASSNFLGDYASIKNGSYYKLMKAYYGKNSSDEVKSIANKKETLTSENKKNLAKVQTTTDALKESADALLKTGSKSLFAQKDITATDENGVETTTKGYDTESIYKAVNSFVTNYNSVIGAVKSTSDASVANRTGNMVGATKINAKSLNQLGITINEDNTLSLDKNTFMKADMGKAKSLFNGNGSYGYRMSAQASLINYSADRAVSSGSTYNFNGSYNKLNNGNLFSTYF